MTERAEGPENFFQKIPKKVKGICVSCIIESETAKIQHKTARYINAAGGADKSDCSTPRNILPRLITCRISQNILSEKGKGK